MNIVYGVSGVGLGHVSRARTVIKHLKEKHKILVISYGQAYPLLKSNFNTLKINGVSLTFQNNKLSLSKTIYDNFSNLKKNVLNWKKIKVKIKLFSPDLFITDMEPVTTLLAHQNKKPLISLDNQHLLLFNNQKVNKRHIKDFIISKYATKFSALGADKHLILSFTEHNIKSTKAVLISPILRADIIKSKPKISNFILVYLTRPNPELIKILHSIDEKFIVYGFNKNEKKRNILFKKNSPRFTKDLINCKAVIATAGFSLISESVYLEKPYFAIPFGHFEQTFNALIIKNKRIGNYSLNPTRNELNEFISKIAIYRKNIKKIRFNLKNPIKEIEQIINEFT